MDVDDILTLMEIERLFMDCYCFLDRKTIFHMYRDFEESVQAVTDSKTRKLFLQRELLNLKCELGESGESIFIIYLVLNNRMQLNSRR
jgi:hypothetical protein